MHLCILPSVRFFASILQTFSNIEEIYRYGNSLSNIATGSSPRQVEESEIDLLAANLDSGLFSRPLSFARSLMPVYAQRLYCLLIL